jgi:hypothetical protein
MGLLKGLERDARCAGWGMSVSRLNWRVARSRRRANAHD